MLNLIEYIVSVIYAFGSPQFGSLYYENNKVETKIVVFPNTLPTHISCGFTAQFLI